MLITFEGLDYSGKSTQVTRAVDRLKRDGRSVLLVREPGGTEIGEKIRSILLDKKSTEMTDISELMLFSASRAQLVAEVIRPALAEGTVVVCDRFYDSTTAYQGWGRGIDLAAVRAINAAATFGLIPDLTIYLDVRVDEIERRIQRSGAGKDRMESNSREFHERVRKGYLSLAETEQRFVVIDGEKAVNAVEGEIWDLINKRLTQVSSFHR
jgi:dTMP kinase